jgi:hypothetical protein
MSQRPNENVINALTHPTRASAAISANGTFENRAARGSGRRENVRYHAGLHLSRLRFEALLGRRAAEAFTSELNMLRCLRMHRIC